MNIEEAESVRGLAKPCVEALGRIGEKKCPECKGSGLVRTKHYSTGSLKTEATINCFDCNGTGKQQWKWEPEVNQTVLYDKKLLFIVSVGKTRLSLLPFDIADLGESLDDYVYTPEIIDVVPILEWEEIERVLEGVGYQMKLSETFRTHREFNCSIHKVFQFKGREGYSSFPEISAYSSSRQEAVMRSVIALGKNLRQELNAKSK